MVKTLYNTMAKVLSTVWIIITISVLIGRLIQAQETVSVKDFECEPCVCYKTTANCNNRRLTYIPLLPANVTILKFKENFLTHLNLSTFANISNHDIERLDISWNRIVNISADALSKFKYLKSLDLGGNEKVDKDNLIETFKSVSKSLKIILLDNTRLNSINGLFTHLAGSEVRHIDISYNQIVHLQLRDFQQLRKLERLSIRKNEIKHINARNVTLPELKSLSAVDNRLTAFPPEFCENDEVFDDVRTAVPKLENVDFSFNWIISLDPKSWRCLKNLKKISLGGNMIYLWTKNAFADLQNLYTLDMFGMRVIVKYISPLAFNSTSLKKLNIMNNGIDFKKVDRKIFQNSSLEKIVLDGNSFKDCTSHEITNFLSPLKNVTHLSMKNTDLSTTQGMFSNLSSLINLILDGNDLKNFDGLLSEVPSLKALSVQGNRIQVLTKTSFPIDIFSNLTSLNIGSNPFRCTCKLLWFKNYIGNTGQVGAIRLVNWPRRYTCTSPASMYKKELRSYNPTEYSCAKHFPLLYVTLPIGIFVIVVSLTSLIIYRNIWYIRYWRYKFTKRCKPKGSEFAPLLNHMIYDSYVIYTDEDRAFVHGYLRQLIEEKMKRRLFIWHRDEPVGVPKVDAIADAIYGSRTVIAILSSYFLNDNWCKFQLDVCVNKQIEEGKECVSLIVMDDVDYKSLNKTWCVLLTKLKTARWCQDETSVKGKLFLEEIREHVNM